jgi:hypothetical protein
MVNRFDKELIEEDIQVSDKSMKKGCVSTSLIIKKMQIKPKLGLLRRWSK